MEEPVPPEPPDVERLIADVVRATNKVHWCRARWESDEQACRDEAAAIAALRAAFERAALARAAYVPRPARPPAGSPPAWPPAMTPQPDEPDTVGDPPPDLAPPPALPPPGVELRFDGTQLLEAVGHGRFHLEQMSANHWWVVFEAEGRRVDVWLHAKGTINATFESVETQPAE